MLPARSWPAGIPPITGHARRRRGFLSGQVASGRPTPRPRPVRPAEPLAQPPLPLLTGGDPAPTAGRAQAAASPEMRTRGRSRAPCAPWVS
ncbi:hypothetical protein CFC35_00920 [Streptomyces sp. FBKL.4005]|nr:hypothetical protein CFC35_00920 [Streptomyces sp. FBKL.4005]